MRILRYHFHFQPAFQFAGPTCLCSQIKILSSQKKTAKVFCLNLNLQKYILYES